MATYKQIIAYVRRNHGFVPKTCWIAHVKEMNGLKTRPAWNRQGWERQVPCPEEKRPAIEDAMRHFGMI
jgi:hypothetical protein